MKQIVTENNKVLINGVEYTPSKEILGVYIDITDSTSFIMFFEKLNKRYNISEVELNNSTYNTSEEFKSAYYSVLNLVDDEIINPIEE